MVKKKQEKPSEFNLLLAFVWVFNIFMVLLIALEIINLGTAMVLIIFWTFILMFHTKYKNNY